VLDGMFSEEQVKQLETAASVHLAQSNIEFSILQAEQDIIHVEVAQNATRSGKYATEATLIKRAHEVFDKVLPGIKLEIEPSTHMPSPTSALVMISFCYTQHFRLFDLMLYTCLQPSYLEKYPSFYHSPQFERLKSFVRSHLFEYIVVFVLLMNLIAVIIETTVWQ